MGEDSEKKYSKAEIILWMVITGLLVFIAMSFHYNKLMLEQEEVEPFSNVSTPEFKKLNKVYRIVKNNFLNEYDLEKMEDGAISGMLEALGDPYTSYFTKSEAENFLLETTEGEYEGIGIYMTIDPDKNMCVVLATIKNSPAAESGVEAGDYIIEVDGKDMTEASTEEIASLVKGHGGTIVHMTFRRYDSGNQETYTDIEKEIERRSVDLNPFEYKMLDENIGYIAFESFDEKAYQQFKNACREMNKMKGLIIDLRGNPGGLLNVAAEIADEILPTGIITYTVDKDGKKDYEYSDSKCFHIPVVALINENSASAAEITAAAIKDWEMGTVVGTTSFGKGLVQAMKALGDGTYVKITISEYFSPKGEKINQIGVIPDVEIEDDKETKEDEQLLKAIEVMKEKMTK